MNKSGALKEGGAAKVDEGLVAIDKNIAEYKFKPQIKKNQMGNIVVN